MLSNKIVVPFIDKTLLDISYARKILKEEDPILLTEIVPVDISKIIEKKGLTITTTSISKDMAIQGMIVYGKGDISLWDYESKCYRNEFCNGQTIFIDSSLTSLNMLNRYRFTLAHEFAHWLLHRNIVTKMAKEKKSLSFLSCIERDILSEVIENAEAHCEWQANYLAGALLMPYLPLKNYCKQNINLKSDTEDNKIRTIKFLANSYIVSPKSMYVRLRQLDYIDKIAYFEWNHEETKR